MSARGGGRRLAPPRRELLLVEVERRCRECGERARLGLTKAEARVYHGFECARCEVWNEDGLAERDIPEWWEELRAKELDAPRTPADSVDEPS